MSDRSQVSITVKMTDFLKHEELFRREANTVTEDDSAVILEREECSDGEWTRIENFLRENKIEFDKFWDSGSNYEHGNTYSRYINGKYKEYTIVATQESILEELVALQDLFEKDINKGLKELKKQIKKRMPWDAKSLKETNSVRFIKEA